MIYNVRLYSGDLIRVGEGVLLLVVFLPIVLGGFEGRHGVGGDEEDFEEEMVVWRFGELMEEGGLDTPPGFESIIFPLGILLFELNFSCFFTPGVCICVHIMIPMSLRFPICMRFLFSSLSLSFTETMILFHPGEVPFFLGVVGSSLEVYSRLIRFFILSMRLRTNLLVGGVLIYLECVAFRSRGRLSIGSILVRVIGWVLFFFRYLLEVRYSVFQVLLFCGLMVAYSSEHAIIKEANSKMGRFSVGKCRLV